MQGRRPNLFKCKYMKFCRIKYSSLEPEIQLNFS